MDSRAAKKLATEYIDQAKADAGVLRPGVDSYRVWRWLTTGEGRAEMIDAYLSETDPSARHPLRLQIEAAIEDSVGLTRGLAGRVPTLAERWRAWKATR